MSTSAPAVYAHSVEGQPDTNWQSMADHAWQVAALARKHADKFGAAALGEVAGLLHDLGKYSDEFQRKLHGANIRVDHSTVGARVAAQRFARCEPLGQLLAYVIAGHHAGLANGAGGGGTLQDRLDDKKYTIPAVMNWDQRFGIAAVPGGTTAATASGQVYP